MQMQTNTLDEDLHWVKNVMQVRKRERDQLVKTVMPERYNWLTTCKKTQVAAILLKLLLDQPNHDKKVFYWPHQCGCSVVCDFCVCGNSASAVGVLQSLALEHFDINVSAWWKRYVRYTTPRSFCESSGKTFFCFAVLTRPEFFQRVATDNATTIANTATTIADAATTVINCETTVANAAAVTIPNVDDVSQLEKVKVYKCNICKLPKKGHICRGIAPPPLPVEEPPRTMLLPPLVTSAALASRSNASQFDAIFTPEDEQTTTHQTTRLERIFGTKRLNDTSTTIDWRKVDAIQTDIDL